MKKENVSLKDIAKEIIPDPVMTALNKKICPIVMIGENIVDDNLVEESSITLPYIYSIMNGCNYKETKPRKVDSWCNDVVLMQTVMNYVSTNVSDIITGALVNFSDMITRAIVTEDRHPSQGFFHDHVGKVFDIGLTDIVRTIMDESSVFCNNIFHSTYNQIEYCHREHVTDHLTVDDVFAMLSPSITYYMNQAGYVFETFIERYMKSQVASGELLNMYLKMEGYSDSDINNIRRSLYYESDNKYITDSQFMYEYCACYMRQLAQEPLHNVAVGILEVMKNAAVMSTNLITNLVDRGDINDTEQKNPFF